MTGIKNIVLQTEYPAAANKYLDISGIYLQG
jgi:hypothetical protein